MSGPRVSICVPVLNGARHLKEALDSAISQDYGNLEVIAVDNCSDDNTARILADYAARFPRQLRIYRNGERVSMVENFNIALSHAQGEFVKILPHDDVLTPGSISALMAAREHDDHLIVGLRTFIFEAAPLARRFFYGNLNRFWRADRHFGIGRISPDRYLRLASRNTTHNAVGEPASALISRSALVEVGGFDPRFHQLCDLKLWHDVGVRHGLRVVPLTVARFRVHEDSQSALGRAGRHEALLQEHLELSRMIAGHFESSEPSVAARSAAVNLALDNSRLECFSSTGDGARTTPQSALERLAGTVVRRIRLKRVYQLLVLKLLARLRLGTDLHANAT